MVTKTTDSFFPLPLTNKKKSLKKALIIQKNFFPLAD